MRILLCGLLAATFVGCKMKDDPEPATAQKTETQQNQAKPAGRAPGGVSGLFLPIEEDRKPASNTGQQQQQPMQAVPANNPQTISKEAAKIVEWPKYKEQHPETAVVDGKVEGWDPFSMAGSAYVSAINKLAWAQFQSDINNLKALEGRPPTYKEFLARVKQYNMKFHDQHPYRLYGYDEKTGTMVMLEDKAIKRKIYKEKDIPFDE